MTPADTAEPFSTVSSFQKLTSISIVNYEDPNRTCTWLEYKGRKYSSISSVPPLAKQNLYFDTLSVVMEQCFQLGKNNCNAVQHEDRPNGLSTVFACKIISDLTNSEPNSG